MIQHEFKAAFATVIVRVMFLVFLSLALGVDDAQAIILFGSGDPAANTTPPGGILTASGWSTQTDFAPSATAIAPNHFLGAAHVGTRVGDPVRFDGLTYRVQRIADAPDSDLRLLEVAGQIDSHHVAEIYPGSAEVGRPAVLHGYGRSRGEPVFHEGSSGPELRGWAWSTSDSRQRWGTNTITEVIQNTGSDSGNYIVALFSGNAGRDEATVSVGDSGGGVFILDADGRWKLAGVMYDVEGPFRASAEADVFFAALFDRRGFFAQASPGNWVQLPESGIEPGTRWEATRVSSYRSWIAQEVARPPAENWPHLFSASSPGGPFTEHPSYAVDLSVRKMTFKASETQRFFLLGDSVPIQSIHVANGLVELLY